MTLPSLPTGYAWEKIAGNRWTITRKTGEHIVQTTVPTCDHALYCELFERGYRNGYKRGYADCKMQSV